MYVDFDEKLSNHPTNYHPPVRSHFFSPNATPAAAFLSPVPPPSFANRHATSAACDKQAISDIMGAQTMVDAVWALKVRFFLFISCSYQQINCISPF